MTDPGEIRSLFDRAMDLPTAEREEFVRLHASRPDIAADVLSLIRRGDDPTIGSPSPSEAAAPGPVSKGEPEPGMMLAEFRLLRKIDEGASGTVWEAQDTTLNRRVAIKLLHSLGWITKAKERFVNEATLVASLGHPGVVRVFRMGTDGDRYFMAMELVPGGTLAQKIETGRKAASSEAYIKYYEEIAVIIADVAETLQYVHSRGIVHRDIKPRNILLDEAGRAKITDFGLALLKTAETMHTWGPVGTAPYMSPEQVRLVKDEIDNRSDIYSLGVVLYEALTFRLPFEGATTDEILKKICSAEAPPLTHVNPSVPEKLEVICLKAMAKEPWARYPNASHLAGDLRAFLAGEKKFFAERFGMLYHARRWGARHKRALLVGGATGLTAVASLSGYLAYDSWSRRFAWVDFASPLEGGEIVVQDASDEKGAISAPMSHHSASATAVRLAPSRYRVTYVSADQSRFLEQDVDLGPGAVTLAPAPGPGWGGTEGMTHFPAGTYTVVDNSDATRPNAVMQVQLPGFYIDQREVSNGEYREFVKATARAEPAHWTRYGYDPTLLSRPVVGITSEDAAAYALWRGKRLPTSLEWEAAARAPDGRLYPWGDDANKAPPTDEPWPESLHMAQSDDPAVWYQNYVKFSTPVGNPSLLSDSNGMLSVFGNVREYTSTVDRSYNAVLVRGRCWLDAPTVVTLGAIWTLPADAPSMVTGFRCARSDTPPQLK